MPHATFVLFDLDGTLSDSAPGILASLRHAFDVNGIARLDAETERSLLGPPFYVSLPPLIGQAATLEVITAYRERYQGGEMYNTVAYPGISDLIAELFARGLRLAVATSKPEHYAVPIVEHLGLAPCFETVGGDELDGSLGSKALVIGKVLSRLGRPDPSTVLMVGDRSHDIEGARAHGIDAIGVAWGYANPGELQAARPVENCATVAELARALEPSRALKPSRALSQDGADAEAP
ncbi:MAG: HAD hydrolase-like protein [Actinomycetota bacterium]|nr:HAD hydrolase-like protein [Actinomycetota bacterium]